MIAQYLAVFLHCGGVDRIGFLVSCIKEYSLSIDGITRFILYYDRFLCLLVGAHALVLLMHVDFVCFQFFGPAIFN